ncbi:hypothetical protein [Citrobacter tructae]|uniref:hypothetical protein n=1 Tax=Citrobacter tructae TaxID=2562449 RepID=UPI003F5712CF
MNDEVEMILKSKGMKEKNIRFLLKLAQKRNISISRAFLLYAWRYYAWSAALLLSFLFPATMGDVEFFLIYVLCFLSVSIISVFFSPFLINFIWCIKVHLKLMGK